MWTGPSRVRGLEGREWACCYERAQSSYQLRGASGLRARRTCSAPGNAQLLPLPPMLMFDRITDIGEDWRRARQGPCARRARRAAGPLVLRCHFKGDPVMPGCLGLDALWQMVGFFLGWLGSAGPRPGARRRRGQVLRPGAADRQEGRLRRRFQARLPLEAGARHRRRLAFEADGAAYLRAPRTLRRIGGLFQQPSGRARRRIARPVERAGIALCSGMAHRAMNGGHVVLNREAGIEDQKR